ncbi:MAG: InlB B-repeat-containing protein, partial [Clostridia bacterium]|nr:InlB B-repeat-containing protein [Clostridia bacterium]
MKTSSFSKRLLSVILALAMMVSLFSGLGSIFTVSADEGVEVGVFIIDPDNPEGSPIPLMSKAIDNYSHSYIGGTHSIRVTVPDEFYSSDYNNSRNYVFHSWPSTIRVKDLDASEYVYIGVDDDDREDNVLNITFDSPLSFNRMRIEGPVYDKEYKISYWTASDSAYGDCEEIEDETFYCSWDGYFHLIDYPEELIPEGKTFVAWAEYYTGVMYAAGTEVSYPTDAMYFVPVFAEKATQSGYFVYFKDYETNQIYDIVYFDPSVDDGYYTAYEPTKPGYSFLYWYTEDYEYDAHEWVDEEPPTVTTYYARWSPDLYEVYTETSGSAYVNFRNSSSAYCGDDVIFKVGSTKDNENISKVEVIGLDSNSPVPYYYDAEEEEYRFTMPAQDVVIKVETSVTEYLVTFLDENGGYYASRTVAEGETISFFNMPFAPFKTGYTFAGWEIVSDNPFAGMFGGNTTFDSSTPVTSNLYVKATYTGNDYRVYKADDCDEELEYLYVRSTDQDKDLTDEVTNYVTAPAGDKVYLDIAPTPTYSITGIAVRERGTGNFVVAPTLLRKYKDGENNDCYEYAFEMPTSNVEIAVYVAANAYDVIVDENIPAGGTYRINGYDTNNLAVPQGDYAYIEIIPEKGYYIESVESFYYDENNNIALPDDNLFIDDFDNGFYSFLMVSSDVYVTINYAPYEYMVSVSSTNIDNYKPVWNGDEYEAIESLDDTEVSKGLVVLLDEFDDPYTDWVMLEPGKSAMLPLNATDAIVGDQIRFIIEECTGYDLEAVVVTYADGTKTVPVTLKDGVYYFYMPADDVMITASFKEETYKIYKYTASEEYNTDAEHAVMGEVNIQGLREKIVSADYKELVEVTAIPKAGYYVESISYELRDGTNKDGKTVVDFSEAARYDGVQLTDSPDTMQSIEFYMPACDVEISVTYGKIEYSIQTEVASGDETGTITVNDYAYYDDEVTCAVTPEYGYVLSKINVKNLATGKTIAIKTDTIDRTYGDEFYFDMPASSVKITATFVKDKYSVIYKDTNNTVIGIE